MDANMLETEVFTFNFLNFHIVVTIAVHFVEIAQFTLNVWSKLCFC